MGGGQDMSILQYWKEIALLVVIAFVLWAGYHLHTLQDKADENASLRLELQKAQAATTNIAKFDSDYTKETRNAKKTDCINQRMPAGIVKLLQ